MRRNTVAPSARSLSSFERALTLDEGERFDVHSTVSGEDDREGTGTGRAFVAAHAAPAADLGVLAAAARRLAEAYIELGASEASATLTRNEIRSYGDGLPVKATLNILTRHPRKGFDTEYRFMEAASIEGLLSNVDTIAAAVRFARTAIR